MPKKVDAIKASPLAILANARRARRSYDKTWNLASKAPLFCKISKKKLPDGKTKETRRTARLIGSHAVKIALSGAALNAAKVFSEDCAHLRMEADAEAKSAPWLPALSGGARMILEQFLCALAQEAALKAHFVREGSGNSKRLNRHHARLGWDCVSETVFGTAAALPRAMITVPLQKKKEGKKKADKGEEEEGEEDYAPPEEEADEAEGGKGGNVDDITKGD
jgi:hypothetical protein